MLRVSGRRSSRAKDGNDETNASRGRARRARDPGGRDRVGLLQRRDQHRYGRPLLGSLDTLKVSGIILSNGDRVWASSAAYGPGEEVGMGQGFESDTMMMVDLMDKDYAKLAELRLLKASEGEMYVTSGTLRLPGQGAWAVTCEGP